MSPVQSTQTSVDDSYIPDHRVEIEPSPRWVRVELNGEFVADSKRVLLLREAGSTPKYYFRQEDVRTGL